MPTYGYECNKCGYSFEKFQQMTDEPIKICPKCKGEVRKLISAGSSIIFKGDGFYSTDYRKDTAPCCGVSNPCDNPKRCCQK